MQFLTFQIESMESITKETSKKEICESLYEVFSKILEVNTQSEDSNECQEWINFCKSDFAIKFWRLTEEAYRTINKWTKTQKGKSVSKFAAHRVMAMILGFARNATRETLIDPLIRQVFSQFKDLELCTIINDFFYHLSSSDIDRDNLSESFLSLLSFISENLYNNISDPSNSEICDLLLNIGVEIGSLSLIPVLKMINDFAEGDDSYKFISVSILRELSQIIPHEFDKVNCEPIYQLVLDILKEPEKIVLQRDKDLEKLEESKPRLRDDEKPLTDTSEMLLCASVGCLPFIDPAPFKHLDLIERLAELSLSAVYSVAESSLYAIRDYILIYPGSHLVFVLSLLLKQTIEYTCTDEIKLKRIFYNISTILYFINQAVELDFGTDGLPTSKLELTRTQLEGSLLVWLCHPSEWIHATVWKILEQLSSPQMRQLETGTDQHIPHLVDSIPRTKRNLGGAAFLPLLPQFLLEHYHQYYLCVNWAWSNLYSLIRRKFENTKANSKLSLGNLKFYTNFLCIAPRQAPVDASFATKHHFLSSGSIERWFSFMAVAYKENLFDSTELVECLQEIHGSCYDMFYKALFSNITSENVSVDLPSTSESQIFSNDPYILSLLAGQSYRMRKEYFSESNYEIIPHFKRIIDGWFTGKISSLSRLPIGSKRDILIILNSCFQLSNDVSSWLPSTQQELSYEDQIMYISKIIKKIMPPVVLDPLPIQQALDCSAVELFKTLCSIKSFNSNFDRFEQFLLSICSRGIYLQDISQKLFTIYLQNNPSRFRDILHYSVASSPSITQSPAPIHEYILCLPLLRCITNCLKLNYELYHENNMFTLFFTSLYFQCSFEVVIRSIAIELAVLLSGRQFNEDDKNEDKKDELSLNLSSKEPKYLNPSKFLPSASHSNREIYLLLTERYSQSIANEYRRYTKELFSEFLEFGQSISYSNDLAYILELLKPWINTENQPVQTSKWIIRSLFEISYMYLHNESVTLCIQELWEEFACGTESTLRIAIAWIFNFCTKEIQLDTYEIDIDRIEVCCRIIGTLIRSSSSKIGEFTLKYLLNQMRNYFPNVDTEPSIGIYEERAALILLTPLMMGENDLNFTDCLSLILQHGFVVSSLPNDLSKLPISDDLIPTILLGIQMREVNRQTVYQRLSKVRKIYFPDSGIRGYNNSERNPYRKLRVNVERTETGSKTKRRKKASNDSNLNVSVSKIARFIDILNPSNPSLHLTWSKLTLNWSLYSTDPILSTNSFAVFATISKSIDYETSMKICFHTLNQLNLTDDIFTDRFLKVLKRVS